MQSGPPCPRHQRAQAIHSRTRAEERFGFYLGEAQLQGMVQAIQSGQARFLKRQSKRITHWEVEWVGQRAVAVYDKRTKTIRTVLWGRRGRGE